MIDDQPQVRPLSPSAGPHTIEIDFADPDQMAEFLYALAYLLRSRGRVRVTIE